MQEIYEKNKKKNDSVDLSKEELKELLIKSHLTHDAMWFYNCQQEFGMKIANKLNRAAIKSFAPIEIKRIQSVFNIEKVDDITSLNKIVNAAFEVFKADFMKVSYEFLPFNCMSAKVHKCWAFDGMKRIGTIGDYECGVFDRIEGWFNSLGLKYEVTPKITNCMMHERGECYRNYKFFFS